MAKAAKKPPGSSAHRRVRNIGVFDMDTGEILDGMPMLIPRKTAGLGNFLMAMQRRLSELAADPDISGEALRVLLYLLGVMDWENWVRLSQTEVADALGMKRPNVSRAIKALLSKDVLEKAGTTVGGSNIYRFNKDICWKGSTENWRAAKRGETPPPFRVIPGGQE